MARTKINITPGYDSSGRAFLRVAEWAYKGDNSMDFDITEIAEYTLEFLPDTNEVALSKSTPNGVGSTLNEIVYSEEAI